MADAIHVSMSCRSCKPPSRQPGLNRSLLLVQSSLQSSNSSRGILQYYREVQWLFEAMLVTCISCESD